jgi:hypothetical protein
VRVGSHRHAPKRFHTFVDIAGDPSPNAGSEEQTIDRLFGGDRGVGVLRPEPLALEVEMSSEYQGVAQVLSRVVACRQPLGDAQCDVAAQFDAPHRQPSQDIPSDGGRFTAPSACRKPR